MKTLAVIFFALCIVFGFIQDKTIIDTRIMIFLCFAFFLSGMACLMIIKSSTIGLRRFEVIETPEYYRCLKLGTILSEETKECGLYKFSCEQHPNEHFIYAIQVENSPHYFKEI